MKISNYSINVQADYSSAFTNNGVQRLQSGSDSLVRVHKEVENAGLDLLSSSSYGSDERRVVPTAQNLTNSLSFNALSQKTKFHSSGVLETQNGSVSFNLEATMQSSHINIKSSRSTDPLVIGLNGALPEFSSSKTRFDINSDGKMDEISTLKKGAGYLAIDANGNGKIDNGTELIGTKNGGFKELASYDDDGNGFIDENDAIYSKLKVWEKTDNKDSLKSIKDAGVGALFTGAVHNEYEYIINGETAALLTGSSFGVAENGKAMSLSQIELSSKEVNPKDSELTTAPSSETTGQSQIDEKTGEWIKKGDDKKQEGAKEDAFTASINSQIDRLEKTYDTLTAKAQYAQTIEEAKEFTQRASMIKGQISVLKASLFKLEAVKFDEVA